MVLFVKHISIEGSGSIEDFFKDKGHKLETVELYSGDKLPEVSERIKAVVILGGPMNVYEEEKYPYLRDEDIFIKKVLDLKIPFLGICLGSQLLAKAAGARVKRAEQEEIGFFTVDLTTEGSEDTFFKGTEKLLDVFHWHGDTFEIPENGTLLATSDACKNQAFRVGTNAYGLQFHLEVDAGMISEWTGEYLDSKDEVEQQKVREMLTRYSQVEDKLKKNAELICQNFQSLLKT